LDLRCTEEKILDTTCREENILGFALHIREDLAYNCKG